MTSSNPQTSLDDFHTTREAQQVDELARAFVAALGGGTGDRLDGIAAREFLSYDVHGTRTRTGLRRAYAKLSSAFDDLRIAVHENVGVLVENDLVALRTILTGTHTGDFAGVPPTGATVQTSLSHILRVRDDQVVEHWQVFDTYRILVAIGAIPGVANAFQQMLGVPESPNGLFVERLGTEFGHTNGRQISRDESRAVSRRLYDGVITTGRADDVDALAEGYLQNTGWTPDGRTTFGAAWAISRGAMPDGLATQTHIVAEHDRVASISVWDGTMTATGNSVDFLSADFLRVEDGVAAEHWDTVDYVRLYQSFGVLDASVRDD